MTDMYNSDTFNHGKIKTIDVSKEMRNSFLDYSMSVIVSRALPDVRDGLKPVHRRILHAMNDLGMHSDKPHKKSARIVGEVIGKYHPHGDYAVYETMVRMAQEFSYRYPLVDGHGNFGSIDGDGAAAMRYTEARMSKISMELLKDIGKDTIDWVDNYDGEEKEPAILPARFPNLLVNGTTGIAVGMATNIPPHNLGETIDATIAIMDNPDITVLELMENYLYGPDFPTSGLILGRSGIKSAYETGRGSITIRAKTFIDEMSNGKGRITITEIPYMVNKATLVEKIANLVRDKLIEGITDLRDESNREGIKIVIELRKDVQADIILNQLFRMTSLQSTFGVNTIVLVNNEPRQLGVIEVLKLYVDHQIEVTVRRIKYELQKAQDRAHILEGLRIALDNLDAILHTIRDSKDAAEALPRLMEGFGLSEIQAKSILDMQFKRLTGLERAKIEDEYQTLLTIITDLLDILANHSRVLTIIKTELLEIKNKYNDKRRSEIVDGGFDMEDEDLIPVEDSIITLTTNGYIKRVASDTYRVQNRGGRGIKGMAVNEDDIVDIFIHASTHDFVCFFTNLGKVYRIKGYRIPAASRTSKGIPVVNLLELDKNEKITTIISFKPDEDRYKYLLFTTESGLVKRTQVEEFERINRSGKIAITLNDDDALLSVRATTGEDEVIIACNNGKAARFNENDIPVYNRTAKGVIGINVDGGKVVGAATSNEGSNILVITEKGYGKKSPIDEYRLTSRKAKGVKTLNVTDKNGPLVAMKAVNGDEDCMITTDDGIFIRINLDQVPTVGRNAIGVKVINTAENSKVSSVAIVDKMMDEEDSTSSEENSD